MVMLNKLNLLYKFMKLTKKCDIIYLEHSNYSPGLENVLTFCILKQTIHFIIKHFLKMYGNTFLKYYDKTFS